MFLTCSQLSCNGHKSDNKVYLLLDHCIVREVSSKKKNCYESHNLLPGQVFLVFVCTWYKAMTKACKFLCIPSNFYRPPYLIQPQNIAHTSQRSNSVPTIRSVKWTWTGKNVHVKKICKIISGKCPWYILYIATKILLVQKTQSDIKWWCLHHLYYSFLKKKKIKTHTKIITADILSLSYFNNDKLFFW